MSDIEIVGGGTAGVAVCGQLPPQRECGGIQRVADASVAPGGGRRPILHDMRVTCVGLFGDEQGDVACPASKSTHRTTAIRLRPTSITGATP